MPTESINSELLFVLIGALPILLTIVYVDRYLARRRRDAANAEYVARMQAAMGDSVLHQFGSGYRANRQFDTSPFADLRCEVDFESATGGFFSRRRRIRDRFGRVVATHYEEVVMAGHYFKSVPLPPARLRLVSRNA